MNVAPRLASVLTASLLVLGCGGTAAGSAHPSTSPSARALSGALTVFAAASLSQAFSAAQGSLQRDHPGLNLRFSFAGSQQLVTQLTQGAPADVVATADEASMSRLVAAGLVGKPSIFARNSLEIVVPPGNPKHVSRLADLASPGLAVVLADPSVPAGKAAQQALARAGVTAVPKAYELDVESVLRTVVAGDADAAIVYTTDARSSGVTGVPIPTSENVVTSYPIAVLTGTGNRSAAVAFMDEVLTGAVHAELTARGFLPP